MVQAQTFQDRLVLAARTMPGLRHGVASLTLAANTDVKVVSFELGHATTHFAQDTYQSVYPDVAKATAEATAELLRGTPVSVGLRMG